MDKAKEAINKMKEEYKKRITELLTEEYEFDEVSVDTVSALSNAHALEAGVHTLNTLERILDDREYASKEWGLEYTEIKPIVKGLWDYEIEEGGCVYFKMGDTKFFTSSIVIKNIMDELYDRGYIENKHIGTSKLKIENDGLIIANTDLGKMVIPPHLFEEMIKEAIKEGYLSYSINLHRFNSGRQEETLEFKMKPKTEEED